MSSILKALKKLEEEDQAQKTNYPLASGMSKSVVTRTGRIFHFPVKAILVVCFITVILTASAWFTANRNQFIAKSDDEKYASPVQSDFQVSHSGEQRFRNAASKPVHENPIAGKTDNTMEIPSRLSPVGMGNLSPLTPTETKKAAPSISSASIESPVKNLSRAPDTLALVEERKEDSRIQLQAIAWSRNPEKRMAVINNQIVREGSSIQGITIAHILEDQVIFREGEESFKMIFGLK